MNQASIESSWFDDEFFTEGAYYADTQNDLLILSKGQDDSLTKEKNLPYFFIKDFYQDDYSFYYPKEIIYTSLSKTLSLLAHFNHRPLITDSKNFDHLYDDDFYGFQEKKDELQKVVLISREEFHTSDFKKSLLHFFYSSLNFGTGYPYGFWKQGKGILGTTPELLFEVNDDQLKTFALAGTTRVEEGHKLLESTKDLYEHNLVVKDIEEKLSLYCTKISKGETYLHPFKHIVHLRTDFKASLPHRDHLLSLVSSMSPTAALGGYPMKESLEFLQKTNYFKAFPKRIFGSSFGFVSKDSSTVLVMIRNIQWEDEKFIIECGGGVVSESVLEKELSEIDLKRNIIKKNYL